MKPKYRFQAPIALGSGTIHPVTRQLHHRPATGQISPPTAIQPKVGRLNQSLPDQSKQLAKVALGHWDPALPGHWNTAFIQSKMSAPFPTFPEHLGGQFQIPQPNPNKPVIRSPHSIQP